MPQCLEFFIWAIRNLIQVLMSGLHQLNYNPRHWSFLLLNKRVFVFKGKWRPSLVPSLHHPSLSFISFLSGKWKVGLVHDIYILEDQMIGPRLRRGKQLLTLLRHVWKKDQRQLNRAETLPGNYFQETEGRALGIGGVYTQWHAKETKN